MAVNRAEVRSGLFVLIALVVLSILIFSVGNLRARFQSAVTYETFLDDARLLRTHDAVTYGGIRVGEVKGIAVSDDRFGRVRITVGVDPATPVRQDSALVLKQDGMLGPKYLEITPGTPGAERARPGSELKGSSPPLLTDMAAALQPAIDKIDRLLGHLDAIVGGAENQENIAGTLKEAKALITSMNDQVLQTGEAARKLTRDAGDALAEIRATVTETRKPLASTLKSAGELTAGLVVQVDEVSAKLLKQLDVLSSRVETVADHVDRMILDADALIVENNKNVYETIRALRDTGYHLEQAAKRVRANPSVLIFGAEETPEERRRRDETEIRLKGRARRYDKEER